MQIDPRLHEIDDCLYRVAIRFVIVNEKKVLLVKESTDGWWALPGGGIDYSENLEGAARREIEEELGVPANEVKSDFKIVHYTIGNVVNGVPRLNLYTKVLVPAESLKLTDHVAEWQWHTKEDFLQQDIHLSFNKQELAAVIFES